MSRRDRSSPQDGPDHVTLSGSLQRGGSVDVDGAHLHAGRIEDCHHLLSRLLIRNVGERLTLCLLIRTWELKRFAPFALQLNKPPRTSHHVDSP